MIIVGESIYTDGGTRVLNGETFAGWSIIARSHLGRFDVLFGHLVITEAHPALSGARTHSNNNTAEMIAMIEALFFLGPHGLVARYEQACICYDSLHAACVCLGTIQAWTHVQLAFRRVSSAFHVTSWSCVSFASQLFPFGFLLSLNK